MEVDDRVLEARDVDAKAIAGKVGAEFREPHRAEALREIPRGRVLLARRIGPLEVELRIVQHAHFPAEEILDVRVAMEPLVVREGGVVASWRRLGRTDKWKQDDAIALDEGRPEDVRYAARGANAKVQQLCSLYSCET